MATSGIITGQMTAQEMGTAAMEALGLLSAGEQPTAEEGVTIMRRLNWLLKSLQARGCNLWRDTEGTAAFGAGVATVTLSPRPVDVIDARLLVSPDQERWLARWEPGEYRRLPNKATLGTPTAFVLDKGVGAVTMTLWPVPQLAATVNYAYARVIEDVTALTQTVDVPQEWTETIMMMLARTMGPGFGAARLDPATFALVKGDADRLEYTLLNFDRPASIFAGSAVYRRRY